MLSAILLDLTSLKVNALVCGYVMIVSTPDHVSIFLFMPCYDYIHIYVASPSLKALPRRLPHMVGLSALRSLLAGDGFKESFYRYAKEMGSFKSLVWFM